MIRTSFLHLAGLLAMLALVGPVAPAAPQAAAEACPERVPIPGGSNPGDAGLSRCVLDSGPRLLTTDLMPPAPRTERRAAGSLTVHVDADGRVEEQFTRPWIGTVDTVFNRRVLETIRFWRFEPGILDGAPVRSGFVLDIVSDLREDTLAARLEWEYRQGVARDTLEGTWVYQEAPPPATAEQTDRVHAALIRRLVEMRVIQPRSSWHPEYCLSLEEGGAEDHARLVRVARGVMAPGADWYHGGPRLAPFGCERDPRYPRVVVPRVHRTESGRVVLYPAGDWLQDWPTPLGGRDYRIWSGRCVADTSGDSEGGIECRIIGQDPMPSRRPPLFPEPADDEEPLRFAVVAMTRGSFHADTLRGDVPELRRLDTHAVCGPAPRPVSGGPLVGGRFARAAQVDGEPQLILVVQGSDDPWASVLSVRAGAAPAAGLTGSCDPDQWDGRFRAAFSLGDIGDPVRGAVTVCFAREACATLDPARHVIAERAHLELRIADLRPEARTGWWGDGYQMDMHIHVDRDRSDLQPLVLTRRETGAPWFGYLPRRVDERTWEYAVNWNPGFIPESDFRIYFLAAGAR